MGPFRAIPPSPPDVPRSTGRSPCAPWQQPCGPSPMADVRRGSCLRTSRGGSVGRCRQGHSLGAQQWAGTALIVAAAADSLGPREWMHRMGRANSEIMADPIVAALARVPLFRGLSPHDLATLATVTTMRPLDVGTVLTTEGEVGDEFFVIERGVVDDQRARPAAAHARLRGLPRRDRDRLRRHPHRDGRRRPNRARCSSCPRPTSWSCSRPTRRSRTRSSSRPASACATAERLRSRRPAPGRGSSAPSTAPWRSRPTPRGWR